jgi:hypothetical protein
MDGWIVAWRSVTLLLDWQVIMKMATLNGVIHFSYSPLYKVAAGVNRASNGTLQDYFEYQVRKNIKASDHGEFSSTLPESISRRLLQ